MSWPMLPLAEWEPTRATLHMLTQIVGKTRLALAPVQNHWWHVALYPTARGLTTSPMPTGKRMVSVDFDFLDHEVRIETSDGQERSIPLSARPVADFYQEYQSTLTALGVAIRMMPRPVEVVEAIPFASNRQNTSYDREAVQRWWQVLQYAATAMSQARSRFVGKASPVHFFWGSFDLAATRFSGQRAPPHPGGAPNCPDYVMVEAYSHECSSWGFWPGGAPISEAAFYAYAYPEPAGYARYPVLPKGATYNTEMHEFLLPYELVRVSDNPEKMLDEFFQSTYEAAAVQGKWDRGALERRR